MTKIILFVGLIAIGSCKPSLKKQARSAAKDYCNCIKDNIFLFDSTQKLFNRCDSTLEKKYRLIQLYFQGMDDFEFRQSFSQQTKDSITEFVDYFMQYSDSCHSIPQTQADRF